MIEAHGIVKILTIFPHFFKKRMGPMRSDFGGRRDLK